VDLGLLLWEEYRANPDGWLYLVLHDLRVRKQRARPSMRQDPSVGEGSSISPATPSILIPSPAKAARHEAVRRGDGALNYTYAEFLARFRSSHDRHNRYLLGGKAPEARGFRYQLPGCATDSNPD
jgi:hypothetical protein